MKKLFTLLFLVSLSLGLFAQKQVSGVVLDSKGEPVIGASIQAKGTTQGTISDYDGKFEMEVPESVKTLVISFVGMATQEVPAGKNIKVTLLENTEVIQEVVVTGFGTVSKGAYGGSAETVKAEDIEKKSPSEISKALAGEVAGVQVITGSGQPGTNATIRIRGVGSLNGSSAPLYVVDGIPYDGDISSIDPGDIASTTILKDATAASLYGSRGANGVIVITTKKGSSQGDGGHIDVDVRYGANMRLLPLYDVITSPEEYVALSWLSLYNSKRFEGGQSASNAAKNTGIDLFSGNGIPVGYNLWQAQGKNLINYNLSGGKLQSYAFDTRIPRAAGYENLESWRDAIFRVGQKVDANVKIHGGTEKVKYYTSFGYLKDEGYYQASDFNRFTVRSNVDFEPKKWMKGSVNLAYTYYTMNNPDQNGGGAMNNGFYYVNAIPPIYPVYMRSTDGSGTIPVDPRTGMLTYDYGNELGRSFGLGINPAGSLRLDKENQEQHEVDAKALLEFKLYKGLKFTVKAGLHYYNNKYADMTNKYYGDAEGIGRIAQQNSNQFTIAAQEQFDYNNTFGDHTISAMVGHENYLYMANAMVGYKSYMADGYSTELSTAIKMNEIEGNSTRYAKDGYFANATYSYKERYHVSGYYRADGSSRYARGRRWGHFGSVSGTWTFTNEEFITESDARDWLQNGKLRLSWGVLGNEINSLYSWTNMYVIENLNDQIVFLESSKGNPDITWERTNKVDLGLELSVNKYLDFEFDYFYHLTDNLVFPRAIAPSVGYSSVPTNDAKMVNQGVEFKFDAHIVDTRNIKLDFMLNGAHYINYMTQMPIDYYDADGTPHRMTMNGAMSVGHSLYDHYNVQYMGVDEKGNSLFEAYYDKRYGAYMADKGNNEYNYIPSLHQWMLEHPGEESNLATTTTNDLTTATSKYLGVSYLPTLMGGFGLDFEAYGFTLSATCSYQLGGYGYDYTYMALMGNEQVGSHNWHVDIRNSWSELNPNSNIPRLSNGAGEYDQYANAGTSRFLTSNSYLSLNNVQIGYNFPKKWIEKIKLNKLNLYVSGTNLAIATARRGYNPMMSFTGSSDTHAYSPLSTIMGGVKFTF